MIFSKVNNASVLAVGVTPSFAADLSVPIFDRGRNAKEREIGSSTMLYNLRVSN